MACDAINAWGMLEARQNKPADAKGDLEKYRQYSHPVMAPVANARLYWARITP